MQTSFWWNEDIKVGSFKTAGATTTVKSGYVGTEWDNELTLALSKNTFIKGQASFFFPGEVIANTTTALGATGDKTAAVWPWNLSGTSRTTLQRGKKEGGAGIWKLHVKYIGMWDTEWCGGCIP